jgi:Mitochondrial carrier protein
LLNGAVAGMIAAACTTPFDVIKTRQQAQSIEQIATETINSTMKNLVTSTSTKRVAASSSSSSITPNIVCNHNGIVAVADSGGVGNNSINTTFTTSVPNSSGTSISIIQYVQHIAQTEGIAALWKCNQARMLKVAPSCAIMISSYELGKLLLQAQQKHPLETL